MPSLTPAQRRTLVRITDAAGVWRHYVSVPGLREVGPCVGALMRKGLLERRRTRFGANTYRPTVTGCEVARGRETVG